jgi:hypothetical protein
MQYGDRAKPEVDGLDRGVARGVERRPVAPARRVVWEGRQAGSGNHDLVGFMILGTQGSVAKENQC